MSLPLELDVRYAAWGETGVFSREIRLTNRGDQPVAVARLPSISWDLPGGDYTLRYLWGSWGQERQLATETLAAGTRRFEQTRGRSTNGYVPWLSLRNRTLGVEYIAELAWSGNWWMQVERQPGTGAAPLRDQPVRVELGMHNDFGGPLTLAPGDTITLPRAVFTATSGSLDDAANQMHRYQRSYLVPRVRTNQPPLVEFNTWFPLGPKVDITNTIQAADAAAAIGAEVYVLDSGWYGSGDWERTLGDYEPDPRKFPRGLEELANSRAREGHEVRAVGGDRERRNRVTPVPRASGVVPAIRRQALDHREPLPARLRQPGRAAMGDRHGRPPGEPVSARLDQDRLQHRCGRSVRSGAGRRVGPPAPRSCDRLLRLAGHDPRRAPRSGRGELLERRTAARPRHHGAHPYRLVVRCRGPDGLGRLGYGCTVQFAPEVCNHWMVGDADSGVVDSTRPPGWWDFMLRVPMNGQFGISGRIPEWSAAVRQRVAANVAVYKRIRGTIAGADVYHLTPAAPAERSHWLDGAGVRPARRGGARWCWPIVWRGALRPRCSGSAGFPRATYDVTVDGQRLAPPPARTWPRVA